MLRNRVTSPLSAYTWLVPDLKRSLRVSFPAFQWHLISSFYDYLPWKRCGVAVANTPWSGSYEVTSPTWSLAHTSQFAPIGWRYASHQAGVGLLSKGGSYVTRVSPDKKDFSIVVEKMSQENSHCARGNNPPYDTSAEQVVLILKGSFLQAAGSSLRLWYEVAPPSLRRVTRCRSSRLSNSACDGALAGSALTHRPCVWNPLRGIHGRRRYSNLAEGNASPQLFVKMKDIPVVDGKVTLAVQPEEIYTITTLDTGWAPCHILWLRSPELSRVRFDLSKPLILKASSPLGFLAQVQRQPFGEAASGLPAAVPPELRR